MGDMAIALPLATCHLLQFLAIPDWVGPGGLPVFVELDVGPFTQ